MSIFENIELPEFIQKKNAKIAEIAIQNTKQVVNKLSSSDLTKIGLELLAKKTNTMDKYIHQIGTATVNDGMKVYLPEILALTVGCGILGSIIGYQISEKKIIQKGFFIIR